MKPILFNTEMVRAILDGRKTVTRRVVKGFIPENAKWGYTAFTPKGHISCRGVFADGYGEKFYKLPYHPGDILYVRETWRPATVQCNGGAKYFYFADGNSDASEKEETGRMKWRPSIHMPKEAARIFLRVTDVRVERLQDITVSGVRDEGLLPHGFVSQYAAMTTDCFSEFKRGWDSTIKPADLDKYGWNANPWVWIIEYERCEKPEV